MQIEWRKGLAIVAFGLFVLPVFAQDEAAEPADVPAPREEINPLVQKFQQGGKTMWFLAALSLAGVSFAMERVAKLRRSQIAPDGFAAQAKALWKDAKYDEIVALCGERPSTLGRVVSLVVQHRDNPMASLNEAAGDIARREFRKHQRRAYPLAVVGTLSPLLGLMGTVFGLMESFEAVAVAGSMDDPSILANSIAKALVTTAAGLIIAVPALVAYHFFKNRTGDLLDLLDEEVSGLMNSWFLGK